jgi:peptidoglycan/LPS O-acetylase OafA/YrhL
MDPASLTSTYRPHIDGLRAIAVIAVILFHIDSRWLPGGFVGVDIFFVISGYLITGIVSKELQEGRFSFRAFYERRVRRILPALWVLLVVCVPVSWCLMLPADAEPMGKSALWSILAMANVYFWREVATDYFAPQSATFPFLHLWSLGVEEQFYLFWPVILFMVWRIARQRARAIACGLALATVLGSTLYAEWLLAQGMSRFAYYMLPTRAGELALGAALSLVRLPSPSRPGAQIVSRVAALLGFGLLGISFALLTEHDPFPGWRALLPTLGCAALILSGHLAPGGRHLALLRWAPALWMGRCSYSAYLWHWPVLAWWRYLWGQPNLSEGMGLLVLIILLGQASQRLIEDPARATKVSGHWARSMALYGVAPALIIASVALIVARGERWGLALYSDADRAAWAVLDTDRQPAHRLKWVCQQHVLIPANLVDPVCEWGTGEAPARALLLGDSFAAQFAPMLRIAAELQDLRVRSIALGSCPPLPGSLRSSTQGARAAACDQGVPEILRRANDFPLLIIGADWATYAHRDPAVWDRLESYLGELVSRNHQVWLLPEVPKFGSFDAECAAKRQRVGDWLSCPEELAPINAQGAVNERLAALAQRLPNVRFLPLHQSLCANGMACPVTDSSGRTLYSDPSHLSVHGSRHLAAMLIRENQLPDIREGLIKGRPD